VLIKPQSLELTSSFYDLFSLILIAYFISISNLLPMSDSASLQLLGNSQFKLPTSPDEALLEVFANQTPDRNYTISLSAPDFASLCPVTGQPDAAKIEISYIPDQLCVETKSLKFYLASYRNHALFNERIVNRILDDLCNACKPRKATVKGQFVPRGGIQLTCTAEFPNPQL
jgi:7-cyano-7-deazaguanine reductase